MKKIISLLLAGVMMLSITACGNNADGKKELSQAEKQGAAYLNQFNPGDFVTLGDYKGIEVTVPKATVTDEEVEEYLNYLPSYYSTQVDVMDRAAVNGDTVDIAFVGKIDGVEFEGGSAESYNLTLGSHQFIDGFEDGVVGMMPGDTKDLELKFPENYGKEDLAGKAVVFTVTVNRIIEYETPELDDEFAKSLDRGYETVDDLREDIRKDALAEAEANRENQIKSSIEKAVEDGCTFGDMPTLFVDRMVNTLKESIEESAVQYGVEPAQVASYYYGIAEDNYEAGIREYCEDMAHMYIMLGAIASENNIAVTDEEMEQAMLDELAASGAQYSLDEYKEILGDLESYREYVLINKVMDFLGENAVINEE